MKQLFKTKYLTLWCFAALLALFFALGLRPFAGESLRQLRGGSTEALEAAFNERLPGKTALVTLNGGVRRLLGERAVNERYKLDNGQLTYTIPALDMSAIAANTAAFSKALEREGVPLLYVNTPFKIDPEDKQLPVGVEDYSNENADRFLALLVSAGVDVLDLREREKAEGLEHYSLFYPTDHHWTAETGFWAVQEITQALSERDASFTVDARVLDADSYDRTVHETVYLGSHGRRVGPWYAGMDDLTVIAPRFDTSLSFYLPNEDLFREGSFRDALLFPEKLTGSPFDNSRYDVYLGGEYSQMLFENRSRAEGLAVQSAPKRILVFKDSFSLVVAPFMALGYDELQFVDLRLFGGGVMDFVRDYDPDLVLVLYNPGALEDNNWAMFDFLR